jgi:antitoxin ParD1/3/4/toxin ParE1/3/4
MKYCLTEAARQDIRDITSYIRTVEKSPQNAKQVATRLKSQFARLVNAPMLGHVRGELDDGNALVVPVSGLLVIYQPTLKPLTILRVLHPARGLGRIER